MNWIEDTANNIRTRDIFSYENITGYVLALSGAFVELGEESNSPTVTVFYADGTPVFKSITLDKTERVRLVKFDNEHYMLRKALLSNTSLEHLTV